jgi:hypothetical protein
MIKVVSVGKNEKQVEREVQETLSVLHEQGWKVVSVSPSAKRFKSWVKTAKFERR